MPCQLVFGTDWTLIKESVFQTLTKFGWKNSFQYQKHDFATTSIDPVVRAVTYRNLLCNRQVVMLDFCDFFATKSRLPIVMKKRLIGAVKNCPADICLFLIVRSDEVTNKQLVQTFKKMGVRISVATFPSLEQLTVRLERLAHDLTCRIDRSAIRSLVNIAPPNNYEFLLQSVRKLALMTSRITSSVVLNNITTCESHNMFELVNYLLGNRPFLFIGLFKTMAQSGFDFSLFLGALGYRVDVLHHKVLSRQPKGSPLTRRQLEWLIDQLFLIDYDLKMNLFYNELGLYCQVLKLFVVWNL